MTIYSTGLYNGLSFSPDGTLYAADGATAWRLDGTNAVTPGARTALVNVPLIDGIAVAASTNPSQPPFLFGNRNNGIITRIDLNTTRQRSLTS